MGSFGDVHLLPSTCRYIELECGCVLRESFRTWARVSQARVKRLCRQLVFNWLVGDPGSHC
jgi:hypothetical protein